MSKPILHLNPKNWITGKSTGQFTTDALFTQMDGINPYVGINENSASAGLLQTCAAATDISSSIIDQKVQFFLWQSKDNLLAFGETGDVYNIDTDTDIPTLVSARGLSGIDSGFLSAAGGTLYAYYFNSGTQIGRFDLASTFVDAHVSGLNSTHNRPVHFWENNWWFGNGVAVGNMNSSATFTGAVLTLPTRSRVTALSDDGYHLVIGANDTNGSPTDNLGGYSRVYFYLGAGAQWEQEWPIPESHIHVIYNLGGQLFAIAGNNLYTFSISNPPRLVRHLDSTHTVAYDSTSYNHSKFNAVTRMGNAMLWGGASYYISSYGKLNANFPEAYITPFVLPTAATSVESLFLLPNATAANKLYIGTNDSKVYTLNVNSTGATSPNPAAISRWIDLDGNYQLTNITFDFSSQLASADVLEITLTNNNNETFATQVRHTTGGGFTGYGAVYEATVPLAIGKTRRLKFNLTFSGGNVRIYSMTVWGDKITSL